MRSPRPHLRAVLQVGMLAAVLAVGSGRPAAGQSLAAGTRAFATATAQFTPVDWSRLPAWDLEHHTEALDVFRASCRSAARREVWREACAAALTTAGTPEAARRFFETAFVPYRVSAPGDPGDGMLTGYFEPVLDGSPTRRGRFVVPVLARPDDLLLLDLRRWQGLPTDGSVRGRIVGDRIEPADGGDGLAIDPAVFAADPLDRRLRARRDDSRIVPYWTRQQIESGAPLRARTLAWVDDRVALYLMQVQGSGQVRMPDGRRIRLAYAEQNGHPFQPRGTVQQAAASRTRSVAGSEAGWLPGLESNGRQATRPGERPASGRDAVHGMSNDAAIERIVDALLAGRLGSGSATGQAAGPGWDGVSRPDGVSKPDGGRLSAAAGARPHAGPRASAGSQAGADPAAGRSNGPPAPPPAFLVAAAARDPSYVFFDSARSTEAGPAGALGVPLTPTRSIAVDPRVTPLGAPVYLQAGAGDPSIGAGLLRRLVVAQDTGGAIRGPVRADFFWGTGRTAGTRALQTRDPLAMWVLLPKGFRAPAASGQRTRNVGGEAQAAAECVIPDPAFCLD